MASPQRTATSFVKKIIAPLEKKVATPFLTMHKLTQGDLRLEILLQQNIYQADFFSIMRFLECAYRDKFRFGQAQRPSVEAPIRLGQTVSLTFEASSLTEFSRKNSAMAVLKQRFFGLFGTNGPMPLSLTDYICERGYRHQDFSFARFADMFHHRMLSLFYRAWANTEPTVSFDRPEQDDFSRYLASLVGLGTEPLRNRDAMPDVAKLYYSGFLACHSKSATGLSAILSDYFRLDVRVEQFVSEWLEIAEADLTRLGESQRTGELGISAVLGARVWSCQHKFRLRFLGLNLVQYQHFLPTGQAIKEVVAMVRNYTGDELSWDMRLILQKEDVPSVQLNGQFHLGWTSWLGQRHSDKDADDLTLNPFWGT